MPRKIHLLTALLIASGALAQPQEVAARTRSGPGDMSTPERTIQTNSYNVRWVKGEKVRFKRPDHKTAAQEVWVTGELLLTDDDVKDVELIIQVENGECHSARIRKNGRFDVLLPAGSRARLTFQKPGHIVKEVLVDASALGNDIIGQGEDRKVDFDVILVPEDHFPGSIYDGPVGSIIFRRGGNAMKVEYHERLVAVEDGCLRSR